MPIPRYRGYGFRNIDGWEIREKCASAGRNLNIVSAGVLIYLISGASADGLSLGGASLSVTYPSSFGVFGFIAFIWFGYRFLLAYRDATDVDPWWHLYMRDIVLQRPPITSYAGKILTEKYAPKKQSHSMSWTTVIKDWKTLLAPEVKVNGTVVARDVEIELPYRERVLAHIHCFPRYLISNSDIADMWVPWLLYGLAWLAILAESADIGPAGLYGLFPSKPQLPAAS